MAWDTQSRFDTAADWVRASLKSRGFKKDVNGHDLNRFADLVGSICKKRKGVWSLLRNPPKGDRALIWHAHKIGLHMAKWGNLAPWSETVTAELMRADDQSRADFDMVLDISAIVAKTIQVKRAS